MLPSIKQVSFVQLTVLKNVSNSTRPTFLPGGDAQKSFIRGSSVPSSHPLPLYVYTIQAPVIQKVDNAIHWINLYPLDSAIAFPNTYPLDSDLSCG